MATYHYKAKRGPKEAVAGLVEAESRTDAVEKLSQQGYYPLQIEEFQDHGETRWGFLNPVSQKDLCFFTRQVADLLESNVPLLRALELTQEQTENAALRHLIKAIVDHIKGGQSFSGALRKFPGIFSPLYVSLVYAGEVGGMLGTTLDRLASFMEQEEDFRSRIWAALAYPLLVAGVGGLTVVFLMVFVVPRLTAMFLDSGQGMPWIARCLSTLSDLMTSYGGLAVLVLCASGAAWWLYRDLGKTKAWFSKVLFKIPVWGNVLKKGMIARFTRTLAMLLSGGVPILEALRVVSQVLEHPLFREKIQTVIQEVEQGGSLSESLKKTTLFPSFICQMMAIGEEANTLEKALEKVSATYERETDRAMKLATSLLEPIMILCVGSVIGVIVIGMLLPIFQISTFVK